MDQIHKLLGHETRWKPKNSWSFEDGLRQRSAKTEGTKRIVLLSCNQQGAVAEPQQVAEKSNQKHLATPLGGAMTNRVHRIALRRLSFNLEDFPETEGERMNPDAGVWKEPTNDGSGSTVFTTPGGTGSDVREQLNLIGTMETPEMFGSEGKGTPHAVVLTAILQSILASQENLANLVSDLRTQVKGDEGVTKKDSGGKQAATLVTTSDDAPVIQAELHRLLQAERGSPNTLFELEPSLTEEVLAKPYPAGYQPPSFRKFDGIGSSREHLLYFLDDLGVHRNNKSLRLKEFSKSLAGKAFTWYAKLRPGSIRSWEELTMEFCGKFLEEEGALHIMDLGRVKQKSGEGLVSFIKCYRDHALQCKETLPEADLVYGCIKNIEDGSQIFLNLGGITTFAKLMRRGADIAEEIKRQGKWAKEADNAFDVCALEEKGRKRNFRGPHPSREYAHKNEEDLPPLPVSRIQVCQLVEECIKDGTIQLKGNKTPFSNEQYDDPSYCILHKTCYHTTMDCWTIRRAFPRQLKAGKVLLPEGGGEAGDLYRCPLLDHGVNAITAANNEIRIEEVKEENNDEEELLSTGFAKTRGFRILFSQLGLDQEAQKEATRALTKIIKEKGGELCAANAPFTRLNPSHATAILFKEPSPQGPEFCHNRPLYVEARIEGIKVTRSLVDNGSGFNILPTRLFRMLNIPKQRVRASNIMLNTFQGEPIESRGCVNAVLEVGPIKTVNVFQVVDGDPSYHLLHGRPWIHLHQCIPSTLHKRIKSNFRGKEIEIPGVWAYGRRTSRPVGLGKNAPHDTSCKEISGKKRRRGGERVLAKRAIILKVGEMQYACEVAVEDTPQELQDPPKQGEEELEEVDVGEGADKKRPLFISKALSRDEKDKMTQLLREFRDVFGWDYDEMSGLSTTLETQQLLGKLGYIRRFIPALGELISPLRELLKEKTPFVWGKTQQESFEQIKQVITSPQVMSPPVAQHPLRLYVAVTDQSVSGLIAQEVDGEEHPVCYLSNVLKDVETRYPKQERHCLGLVYVAQKYRHYFQAHTIEIMKKSEGIKYMLQNPSPTGRVSKWELMLSEYDLRVVHPQREMPEVNMCQSMDSDDWWILQFDGTSANPTGGAGVVLSNGKGEVFAFSHHLSFSCTNNEAEYEALIFGLRMDKDLGVDRLRIRGDSNLVIKQVKGEYGTKESSLVAYHDEALRLIGIFEEVEAMHVPRAENKYADALATIGSRETRDAAEEIVIFRRMEQSSLAWSPRAVQNYCTDRNPPNPF
ncbi:Ribonuclease H domain [Sesbania bispinosa]|nr:Ribonuclease H domain [Sesbania bispinosa]